MGNEEGRVVYEYKSTRRRKRRTKKVEYQKEETKNKEGRVPEGGKEEEMK